MPTTAESSSSNGRPVKELEQLLKTGDFNPRDSQVNITIEGPQKAQNSLRPGSRRRYLAVVGALVAAVLALTTAIWKLLELFQALK